jgi:hypothetical protein
MSEKVYKYLLPIKNDLFFYLSQDKSNDKVNKLINKHIIFELWDKEKHTVQVIPGKLLEYKDNYLLIRQYDDGAKETKKLWTNYDGTDLFKDFEGKISIDSIRGIEEYKKYNSSLEFKEEYKNCICEITNKDSITITVLIHGFDGYELEFDFKYRSNDDVFIGTSCYPLYFIKEIKIIKCL